MKTLKTLTLGLLAAAFAGTAANAQTVIHVVGSTAFRAPATAAIIDYLNSTSGNGVRACFSSSNILGAGAAIFANGTVGSGGTATTIIETAWTGSVAGAVDISIGGSASDKFIDVASLDTTPTTGDLAKFNGASGVVTVGSAGTVAYSSETAYGGGFLADSITTGAEAGHPPDLTFSDSINSSIAAVYKSATQTGTINGKTQKQILNIINNLVDSGASGGNANNDGFIGVLPFEWVIGDVTSAGLTQLGLGSLPTNMSQQAASALIGTGYIPLALLDGGSASTDVNNFFYCDGRNEDSGSRVAAFSESQIPFGPTGVCQQYQITGSTGSGITAMNLWAANTTLFTESAVTWNTLGHSGYTSGSAVQGALDFPENGQVNGSLTWSGQALEGSATTSGTFLIGYVGITDAVNAVTGGATALSYNGVPYTIANVLNGKYSFWAYEHAYQLSTASSTVQTIDNAIADDVHDQVADIDLSGKHSEASGAPAGDQAAGILPATMNVNRSTTEGGPISHN
jgi:hypothetical protein